MSWQVEEEEANRNEDVEHPADWNEREDSDEWRHKAQEEIDNETKPLEEDDDDNNGDGTQRNLQSNTKNRKRSRARTVSKHYNLESTEPLSENDRKWIFIKSIILWLYLVIISTGIVNNKSNSPQTIWLIAYMILFIFWCLFFRLTASSSRGGFYPLIGDWKQQIYHTLLFFIGLGGVDMYYLESKRIIMRECIMQYKVVEFSILWFAYFISLSWKQYPWSKYIDEEYKNWSTNFNEERWWELINTIPILLLLMDSIVHYSKVYHSQFWDNMSSNFIISKIQYIGVLIILYIDTIIRGLLLILFVRISSALLLFVLAAYVLYLIFIWITALGKSMDAPVKQFKLTMKKSGGKLIQAIFISFWSVCGLFQILPTIKSSSSDIQQQQRIQQKWGKNVIRFDCFVRLFLSVVLFTKFWIMRNWKFEFEQKFVVYVILIIFALYPYAMELLFQTPLSLLCRGSFFLIHHVDTLTSLPNIYRFNKDIQSKMSWKMGMIVTNIRKFTNLNDKYGRKCGDITLTQFMQRIVFEMEDNSSIKMALYRIKNDRFLIVTGFPTENEFKEFIESLSQIEITVLRPSDYDENKNKYKHKKKDDIGNEEDGKENDDFINPNSGAIGGYGDSGDDGDGNNWFDDDDDDNNDNKDDDGGRTSGNTLKIGIGRKRNVSSFNRKTANESLLIGLRIAGSFGPFCSLSHALKLDAELQENDKKGYIERDEDKYNIVELKDFAE